MGIETVLLGAALGVSIFGTRGAKVEARRAQATQIAFDARSARLQSKAILEEAELEATEIRREGELLGKKQTALTAKAGLKLGRGTAAAIQEETKRLTEKEVTTTLEAARRKSKQLLKTFPEEGFRTVSLKEFEKLRTLEKEESALESGVASNTNFIKSPKKHKTAFTGL